MILMYVIMLYLFVVFLRFMALNLGSVVGVLASFVINFLYWCFVLLIIELEILFVFMFVF